MKSKQQLIVGIAGKILTAAEREVLEYACIHGVILFTRNYHNPTQLQDLCADLHQLPRTHPLQIYVDQEGGRVQRFRDGFTTLPAPGSIQKSEAFAWAELMATELKYCGVDFSFAPTVDLNCGSQVIGDRAFAAEPEAVIAIAREYMAGMRKADMLPIIKHFPGHGSVVPDTHHQVAIDERSLAEIEANDLVPFKQFMHDDIGVMVSHVIYPKIDAAPASLSHFWITDYLRGTLGFTGSIFSDDLGMGAVAKGTPAPDLVLQTFAAGADYALLCNDWQAVVDTLRAIN